MPMLHRLLGAAAAASLLCAPIAAAQCTESWSSAPVLSGRGNYGTAFDTDRNRLVLFGGQTGEVVVGDTWEFDGTNWSSASTPAAPSARQGPAMAYDPIRHKTVLFGGSTNNFAATFNDTWEWNGSAWTLMASGGPAPRGYAAAAFDGSRGKVVLHGGFNGSAGFNDTYEWTGSAWTPIATGGPSARGGHAMAYDAAHTRLVLFGGFDGASALGDTWQFAAGAWTQVTATTPPSARLLHGLAYDTARARVVLFGGQANTGDPPSFFGDTWELNGSAWAQRASTGPGARGGVTLAYDPAHSRSLTFSGDTGSDRQPDLWAWNGTAWSLVSVFPAPTERNSASMTYDAARGLTLLYGGDGNGTTLADFWSWNGRAWALVAGSAAPGARQGACFAYDSVRRRVVLTGGSNSAGTTPSTWEWDGSNWSPRDSGPSSSDGDSMAFDSARSLMILFTGSGQTWSWDGQSWALLFNTGPSPRSNSAMAFDAARSQMVLFGGWNGAATLQDTWELNGAGWTQRSNSGPPARQRHVMVFDSERNHAVLLGGLSASQTELGDAWEWNGSAWSSIAASGPSARFDAGAAYDASRARLVLMGGAAYNGNPYFSTLADTWELGAPGAPVLTQAPASGTITDGSPLALSVAATGGPFTFQWRLNGAALSNGPSAGGGTISGATSANLSISALHGADAGGYDCVIANACGPITTPVAEINVPSACGSADFNCDGDTATDADIESFFACLAGDCPPPPCTSTADFNGDGDSATDADIEAFFRILAGGTC